MTKHKHYDLIVAWAAGAEIEVYILGAWHIAKPYWYDHLEYRVAEKIIERDLNIHFLNDTVYIGDTTQFRNCKFTFKGDVLVGVELIDQ